jgi:hypothetical protein
MLAKGAAMTAQPWENRVDRLEAAYERLDGRIDRLDAKFDAKFDALRDRLDVRFDVLTSQIVDLRRDMQMQLGTQFRWTIGLIVVSMLLPLVEKYFPVH